MSNVTCHTCKGTGKLESLHATINKFVPENQQWMDLPFFDIKKGDTFILNGVKDPASISSKEGLVVYQALEDAYFYPEDVVVNGRRVRTRAVLMDDLLIVPNTFAVRVAI